MKSNKRGVLVWALITLTTGSFVACGDDTETGPDQTDNTNNDDLSGPVNNSTPSNNGPGNNGPGNNATGNNAPANNAPANNAPANNAPANNAPADNTPGNNAPNNNANHELPALTNLVAEVASKVCSATTRCCQGSDLALYFGPVLGSDDFGAVAERLPPQVSDLSEDACVALATEILQERPLGSWRSVADSGFVELDVAAFEACSSALDTAECGEPVRIALTDATCFGLGAPAGGDRQRSLFPRSATEGPCTSVRDGFGGIFYGTCDPNEAFCCSDSPEGCDFVRTGDEGTCRPVSQLGEQCSAIPPYQLCATGLACASGVCAADALEPLAVGEPCNTGSPDFLSLGDCDGGWCDILGTNACEALLPEGASCSGSDTCSTRYCAGECTANLVCSGSAPNPNPGPNPGPVEPGDTAMSTFAGDGRDETIDGAGVTASISAPHALAFDATGTLYVAEYNANQIRTIAADGAVTTLAILGVPLAGPAGLAIDGQGRLYVANRDSHCIVRISNDVAEIFAGDCNGAQPGLVDDVGSAARFSAPRGIGFDANGNLLVADSINSAIRAVAPDGTVTTLIGDGVAGWDAHHAYYPWDVTSSSDGTIYVVGQDNCVRRIAGGGATHRADDVAGLCQNFGNTGTEDGDAANARFNSPKSVLWFDGELFVADSSNHRIRRVVGTSVTTIAGSGTSAGFEDGRALESMLADPRGMAVGPDGNLYIADFGNNRVRMLDL